MHFKNKTIFISGASRGIGKAIALKLAADGANIIVAAKSVEEDPRLGGTIFSAAKEIEAVGGKALAVQCDIRSEEQIQKTIEAGVEQFGGIDILINNASAINLTSIEKIESKHFDLMNGINVKGTFFVSKLCVPYLKKSGNPHILSLAPPVNLNEKWFANHTAYTISKYGMSMVTLGLSAELKKYKIAANTLWPKTIIDTAAIKNLPGGDALMQMCRTPDIIADAAYYILSKPAATCTGNNFIDEEVLLKEGITNFEKYNIVPGGKLYGDLFI